MTIVTADRVKETTITTGTGAVTLAGAVAEFRTFASVFGSGTTAGISYCIHGGTEWEVGKGSLNGTTGVLTRTTVEASSNAGALVNFSAGTKNVFTTFSAADAALVGTGGGGTGLQVIGYAASTTVVTVANPDPSTPTTIDSLSVTFTIASAKDLRLSTSIRFSKAAGFIRGNFFNGSTDLSGLDVHTTGSASAGWYSYQSASGESGNQQLSFSQLLIGFAAGTYTFTVKGAAAAATAQVKWGERSFVIESLN